MFQAGYEPGKRLVSRMATIDADGSALRVMKLRILAETARAMATGVTNVALGRASASAVVLEAGDRAPDFEAPASDGVTYRLADFLGRKPVIIAWFPKAFTSGCTAECRSLATYGAALANANVQCFGASCDTPALNAEFADALGLTFPILSDPDRTMARTFGVLSASGFASRWTFFIAADGRIVHIDKQVRTSSHGSDVVARLMELDIS
jgi:thioredoxin-dependent peroxiredoxin